MKPDSIHLLTLALTYTGWHLIAINVIANSSALCSRKYQVAEVN